MEAQCDVAVIGSGFAGSLMAMIARRLGLSVMMLESGRHPRFAIGESSVPLANLVWEELAGHFRLPRLAPLAKWGTWQQSYPQISCGLKRGFSFFHHEFGEPWQPRHDHCNELLVAANPHNALADTHWYRSDLDEWLVNEAQAVGVQYGDQVRVKSAEECQSGMHLIGCRGAESVAVTARFVVDATGPRGCLHSLLALGEKELPPFPHTQALYTHFTEVKHFADIHGENGTPYPIDQAAVHHVFDGGWIWVLHFKNGVTSAGVAATSDVAERFRFAEGAVAWDRLLQALPAVKDQFAEAKPVRPFVHSAQPWFRTQTIAGRHWAMLPSAAGFVDPLLSTGFPLTLLGVSRLAALFEKDWGTNDFAAGLSTYAQQTDAELLAAARLIAGLYRRMNNFEEFTRLSLLYFAAASYSETVRRLGKGHLAQSFLLHDHPEFGPACQCALDDPSYAAVMRALQPIDIAGLSNQGRGNWYPVEAADLLRNAHKVEATEDEVREFLERCGFWN